MNTYKLTVKNYKNGKIKFKIDLPKTDGAKDDFVDFIKFLDLKLDKEKEDYEKCFERE